MATKKKRSTGAVAKRDTLPEKPGSAPPKGLKMSGLDPIPVQSVFVQGSGTGFIVILTVNQPAEEDGKLAVNYAIQKPVALLSISPGTAKDMAVLLAEQVAKHEADFGPVDTPFLKRRRAANGRPPQGR